jgi:hypothetical protein
MMWAGSVKLGQVSWILEGNFEYNFIFEFQGFSEF